MASLYILTEPITEIDYSLIDNRVREFIYYGVTLYCEDNKIETEGWEDTLVDLVKRNGLNGNDGRGLHAFVYGLIDRGLLVENINE